MKLRSHSGMNDRIQPGIIAIPGALLTWLTQNTARSVRHARRRVMVRTQTESRWMILGADGRHVSLGRTEPSEAEVKAASDALVAQGLSGWLAHIQGEYSSRSKLTLEPLRTLGSTPEADWQTALTAFHAVPCDATGGKP
jgi:hypothetical protein